MPGDTCDVLIVGGGPAGSTCARRLRQCGLDVLVTDKRVFPRDKVCAGWITPAVVESLEIDLDDYAKQRVLQPIRGFRIGTIGGAETRVRYDDAVSFGILRREFDHYLLARSGARLELGEGVRSIVRDAGAWLVNGRLRASLLVGAGGHFCPVARMLGGEAGAATPQNSFVVVAQEAEFLLPGRQRRACGIERDVAQLYFCPDLKGYGWCFAKGGYLNVGLGREDSAGLPRHVEQFRAWLQARGGIPATLGGRMNGHAYLLYPRSPRPLYDDAVMLIGDAAGLAYPRSGEGIRPAVESALLAAQAAVDAAGNYARANLAPYAAGMTRRFGHRARPENPGWLPQGLERFLAARLFASAWFARNVVIDRWFLHAGQPALPPPPAPKCASAHRFGGPGAGEWDIRTQP